MNNGDNFDNFDDFDDSDEIRAPDQSYRTRLVNDEPFAETLPLSTIGELLSNPNRSRPWPFADPRQPFADPRQIFGHRTVNTWNEGVRQDDQFEQHLAQAIAESTQNASIAQDNDFELEMAIKMSLEQEPIDEDLQCAIKMSMEDTSNSILPIIKRLPNELFLELERLSKLGDNNADTTINYLKNWESLMQKTQCLVVEFLKTLNPKRSNSEIAIGILTDCLSDI